MKWMLYKTTGHNYYFFCLIFFFPTRVEINAHIVRLCSHRTNTVHSSFCALHEDVTCWSV